jgi:hypothetical protein
MHQAEVCSKSLTRWPSFCFCIKILFCPPHFLFNKLLLIFQNLAPAERTFGKFFPDPLPFAGTSAHTLQGIYPSAKGLVLSNCVTKLIGVYARLYYTVPIEYQVL